MACTAPVLADESRYESIPVQINPAELPTMRVTIHGRGIPPTVEWIPPVEGQGGIAGCQNVVTHTNANFSGGSYNAQAGFAENEIAAVSYPIPAGDFPIRVDLFEFIFVTVNAIEQTTTQYSVLFWDGVPNNGTLVATFNSDNSGTELPPIVLGPGTAGVNVQVLVDPNDPEQIFMFNNGGSNRFSCGVRINDHHVQTANPCLTAPPSNRNAFPTTDIGGVASLANNWLFGINCGTFGCPSNGGWATFQALPSFCRPTGDWVMRATYTPVNCQVGVGACCLANGSCELRLVAECDGLGDTYQGDGSQCFAVNCPAPVGACCFQATGGCLNLTQSNCGMAGGSWLGGGTACGVDICFPSGACCLPDGSCLPNVSPGDCTGEGGNFQGHQSTCGGVNCPLPTGACCFSTGFCLSLTLLDCSTAGASWIGAGTSCSTPDICTVAPECLVGDANCDGTVNNFDIDPFVAGILDPGNPNAPASYLATGATQQCWEDRACWGDVSGDENFNNFDIDPFVDCIINPPPQGVGCN
ncbi:MAG: hypothetical protein HRU75_00780 [Planctomycetia bacterium]|nr:MAG: hypothetical protein HRU75_00780 [Planctomycetia bacterium]